MSKNRQLYLRGYVSTPVRPRRPANVAAARQVRAAPQQRPHNATVPVQRRVVQRRGVVDVTNVGGSAPWSSRMCAPAALLQRAGLPESAVRQNASVTLTPPAAAAATLLLSFLSQADEQNGAEDEDDADDAAALASVDGMAAVRPTCRMPSTMRCNNGCCHSTRPAASCVPNSVRLWRCSSALPFLA